MALSNSMYNAIMREYDYQRAKNRHNLNKRIDEVYEAIPEMRELDSRAGASALARFRKYVKEGDKSSIEGYSSEVDNIKQTKAKLLSENGFEADYMQERYLCNDCKDTGYIDGKRCHCFNDKVVRHLYEKSNLDILDEKADFENFNLNYFDDEQTVANIGKTVREYMNSVLQMCKKYVENFGDDQSNLMFTGATGVGKTFLSTAIAKGIINKAKSDDKPKYYNVIYFTATDFFDILAKARIKKDEEYDEFYEIIKESDLLIIDDLGTEGINSWSSSQLFYIIDYRLKNNRATIITTNTSIHAIRDNYSERVSSRILGSYKIIPLYGEDIRKIKKY